MSLLMTLVVATTFGQNDENVVLIRNVNIFDGVNEQLLEGYDVLVVKNLIKKIDKNIQIADSYEVEIKTGGLKELQPTGHFCDLSGTENKVVTVYEPEKNIKKEVTVKVIDGEGRTLMPGLIDAHWHTTYAYTPPQVLFMNQGDMSEVAIRSMRGAEETLMRGFTTVRDVGGNSFAIKKLIDAGEFPGHRILPSGPFMSQTSGHADFYGKLEVPRDKSYTSYWERNLMAITADGVPEVRLRTRDILKLGVSQIKITTGGGVGSEFDPLDVNEFSEEEIKAIVEEAGNFHTYVTSHVYTDEGVRRSIEAGVMCIEHGFYASEETLKLMKEKGAWICLQPVFLDDMTWDSPIKQAKFEQMIDAINTIFPLAKKAGVNIAVGKDHLFGPKTGYQQSEYVVRLGKWFTPYEALKIYTSENARMMEMSGPRHPYQEGPLGVVKEGAYADLILVDGNPLKNLELVGDPENNFKVIMKDGKVYKNSLE